LIDHFYQIFTKDVQSSNGMFFNGEHIIVRPIS